MAQPRVVLDTNVLVAGMRSRRGASFEMLSLLGSPHFEVCVSVPLVFEYEDVLIREALALPRSMVNDVLDYLCHVAHKQQIHFLWRPFLMDPKDDLVVEVSVASQSTSIITFNLKDFSSVTQFGIRAETPGDFLDRIGV